MKQCTKRMLALVLAAALLITCGISGLVLPASAAAGDVLLSENFEGDTTNAIIDSWVGKGQIVEDPLNAGNKVLKLTTKLSSTYSSKNFGLKVNTTYLFTFKAYGTSKVYAGVNTGKGILNNGVNKSVNTTAGWTEFAYIIKTTDMYNNFKDDAYTINMTAPVGTYLDDFKLEEIENASQDELVIGGDFEYPLPVYQNGAWYYINNKMGGVVADPDDPTNHVLRINARGNGNDNGYKGRIGLKPSTTYVLRMRAKGKNLCFYFNSSKGVATGGGTWHSVLDSKGSETWKDYELTFTTKATGLNDSDGYIWIFGGNKTNPTGDPDAYVDNISITRAPATAIAMSQDEMILAQGLTEPLELNVTPIGGKMDSLVWKSSDETLATVDADGNVTACTDKTGDVTITATATVAGQEMTASRVITIVGNADSFSFKEEAMHLAPGVKKTAVVLADPNGAKVGNLTFISSDEAVATVDASGVVTAVAAGTATITVKNADNEIFATDVADTLTVTVDEFGERVAGGDFETDDSAILMNGVGTVAKDSADRKNQVLQLAAKAKLTFGGVTLNANKSYKLTFKGRGTDVTTTIAGAVAGNKGDVKTSLKAGSWTTVTRTFTVGADATAASIALTSTAALEIDVVSLVELPEATSINVIPEEEVSIIPNGTATVTVEALPKGAFAGDVTYLSTNPEVATVSSTGKVKAVGKSGSTIIVVTSKNEKGETMTDAVSVKVDEYANILSNGDFEQGASLWTPNISSVSMADKVIDGAGVGGSRGVELSNTKGKKIELYYKGDINLLPGTTYKVSFDYKTTKSGIIRLWTGTLGFGQVYSSNSKGEWKTAEKVFTTSTNIKHNPGYDFVIVIEEGGDEEMIIDNMRLELYSSGVDAESVEMDRKEIRLVPGRSTGLGVVATPITGDTNMLVWTSSNENVATVEYGVVTAVGKGVATITATTRNGKKAVSTVTVSGDEVKIGNGTFDIKDDTSWTVEGSASIADGVGVKETAAGKITAADGKLSQTVKALKPKTNYTLSVRFAGSGNVGIALTNGTTELVKATEEAATSWTTKKFTFTTGETVEAESLFALTLAGGNGPVYFDYIYLAEDATLIDLVVSDIYWMRADKEFLEQEHQLETGTEVTFIVAALNQGEDPVTAGMKFDVEIRVDGKYVQTISYTATEEVAPGDVVAIEGTEVWKAVKGDHTVSACVNSTLTILELDDSNNDYYQKSLHVADELFEIPQMAEQAGFTQLIFNDEFESLDTIDLMGAGEAGYKWYITRPYSNYKQTPDDYSIKDGVLTMKNKDSQFNYGMATIDDTTARGFTFNKGYIEFRLRIPSYDASKSGGPAVWSFPADKIVEKGTSTRPYAVQWVEMDWMEYWGITKDRPGGHWTISMHETIRAEKADGTGDSQNVLAQHSAANRHKEGLGDAEWHVISFLWLDNLMLGYLDGVQCFKSTYAEGEFPTGTIINNASEDGTGAFAYMNEQKLALILGGSISNQMELDYIRVWSGSGSGDVPNFDGNEGEGDEGIEGEPGDIIVDIPAADFWNNYCLDLYGDVITVENMTEESAEYVLMGEEYWALLSAERQAEINALLKENGQPTFEELLKAAKALLGGDVSGEDSPETGERASALPVIVFVVMIACAVALWATRKRRAN